MPKPPTARLFFLTTLAAAAFWSPSVRGTQPTHPVALPHPQPDRAAALAKAAREGLDYVPGELLVRFETGVTTADRARVLSSERAEAEGPDVETPGPTRIRLEDGNEDPRLAASRLAAAPEVAWAEPNLILRPLVRPQRLAAPLTEAAGGVRPMWTPNDPSFTTRQWNLAALNMERAWELNAGASPNIVVAIVDTGVTTVSASYNASLWTGSGFASVDLPFQVNPDLDPSRFVAPADFTTDASDPDPLVLDLNGHGTHVASTAVGWTNNGLAVAGIAYNARLMPVKVCVGYWELMIAQGGEGIPGYLPEDAGGCPADAVAAGIRYAADAGAAVINLSLGGGSPSRAIQEAVAYAASKGTVIVIAMGNAYLEGNPVMYPAAYAASLAGVVSVSAVGRSLAHAYYSSAGTHNEIAAPGGSDRDGGADGYIWQATLYFPDQDPAVILPRFDRYAEVGYIGTSMATPHVTGTAALLLSALASAGVRYPPTIELLLLGTALDLGTMGRDVLHGAGLVQPRAALRGQGLAR